MLARIYISLTFVLNVISTSLIGAYHFFGKGRKLAYLKSEMVDIATGRKDPSSRADLLLPFPFSLLIQLMGLNLGISTLSFSV